MGEIVLVDTSVLMNVLDVRGFNQNREPVLEEFEGLIEQGAHLFLPMAAVMEAGNHIAQLRGELRRSEATKFAREIRRALQGDAPWRPMELLNLLALERWLDEFPDAASRGLGIGDLSIQKDWETLCDRHPLSRVRVWTLDSDLDGLDRRPKRRR